MARKKPETRFKERVLPLLRALPNSWWVKVQQVSVRGTPDILGCINGTFFAIELKSEDGEEDALQAHNLRKISQSGGIAFSMYPSEWEEVYENLKGFSLGQIQMKAVPDEDPKLSS